MKPIAQAAGLACAPASQPPSATPRNLQPIEPQELAVRLATTLGIWKLPDNWEQIAPHYRRALADMPPDLVELALDHVTKTSKFFPKPSELRDPVKHLLEMRRDRHARAEQRRAERNAQIREREEWLAENERRREEVAGERLRESVAREQQDAPNRAVTQD